LITREKSRSNSVEGDAKEHEDRVEELHMLECYSVRENRVEEGAVADGIRIMRSSHTRSEVVPLSLQTNGWNERYFS
jgi:hypothetical protein